MLKKHNDILACSRHESSKDDYRISLELCASLTCDDLLLACSSSELSLPWAILSNLKSGLVKSSL